MKIRALNEPEVSTSTSDESCSNEDNNKRQQQQSLSKEAAEEQCFDKYRRALVAIQEDREDEARELLDELNDELDEFELAGGTFKQLKFSVLKNLGNLQHDTIDHYIEALGTDPTDICLWIRAGDRAIRLKNFTAAKHCFEQALDINSDNCIALDRLIELYYILHLPFELYDVCMRALTLNKNHKKAQVLLDEAIKLYPCLADNPPSDSTNAICMVSSGDNNHDDGSKLSQSIIEPLQSLKRKRQELIKTESVKFKKARLSITLDTARTQSLASLGNYIIKVYERYSKQGLTRNTIMDVTLNNTLTLSQQFTTNTNGGSMNSQSNNQNSSEPQTTSSQDIDMALEGDGASISDNDKSNNRNEPTTTSNDDNDQTKSNSRGRLNQTFQKSSSLSFAAMLFPMDLGDKRRSSRNRSNQDDTFSFKMKFDELNDLLPECLRIGAIEQVLQKRREEQERCDEKAKDVIEEPISIETNLDPIREDLINKEIIEAISAKMHAAKTQSKNDIKVCDMFYLYLSKISIKKQNTIPEAFPKIYKIYRRLCPLTTDVFIEVGSSDLSLEELWFTLTANEISYQHQECLFLLRLLEQLKIHLDEAQHREFLVRLFLVLGVNSDYRYLEEALLNIEEDTKVYAPNRKIITRAHIKTLIDRANEKLQQDDEEPNDSLELINRLATKSENEMSDREILSLCSAIKSAGVWQRGMDILNQRNDLNLDIIIDTINECLKNGAEMDAILASKLCKDAISGTRPATWTCLYRGWLKCLREEEKFSDENIEKMDKFFELGHQTLGKKCCCNIDKGEFLMIYVKHLLLDERENFEERELLGALNCLFGYPSKKPASVAGHKATRVPMIWPYAEVVYHYFEPEEHPTYMSSLRKVGLSSEMVTMFKEIADASPDNLNPKSQVHLIENFIVKGDPIEGLHIEHHEVTKDLYYFLADYFFKNKDFDKAKQYYNYDLVINPDRFDSWAASGLIRANGIDKALSEGKVGTKDFVSGTFHDLANSAIRCFDKATSLKPDEAKATLWIEFGNLTYNLTALASRLYTYDNFEVDIEEKDSEDITGLQSRHRYLYTLAERCFQSAIEFCHSEEVWLHYYMLGKIHEKMDVFKALDHYCRADVELFAEGATYPLKISYHNPPELAYEAMEVHYRIHSCALKFLLSSNELTQEQMEKIKRILLNAQRSPFVELGGVASFDMKRYPEVFLNRDVGMLLTDMMDSVCNEAEFDELVFMSLHGIKRCLTRCDKNFKALYRLASYYHKIQDSRMAQDILLARELDTDRRIINLLARKPGIPEFMAAPPDLKGIDTLFKDRKIGNLFFNIWRIPVEEVDRPGSFEHWMFKCTWLLIRTCIALNDTNMLSMIAFQLSRQPETSKRYLQDRPRLLLASRAVKSIIAIVLGAIESADSVESLRFFIKEGLVLADRFIKANVFADKMRDMFNTLQMRANKLTMKPATQ